MIGENNISVICCWNNSQQYQTFVDSLKKQTVRVKVIGIDDQGKINLTMKDLVDLSQEKILEEELKDDNKEE